MHSPFLRASVATQLYLLICLLLSLFITGSCNSTTDLSVSEIPGTLIEPSLGDSLFMGRIHDLEVKDGNIYIADDRSQIFILDTDFNLLTTANVSGQGPGEVERGSALQAVDNGFLLFDTEGLKFVRFDNSLNVTGEYKVSDLFPHLGFSFLTMGSDIYTADNSTGALISRFAMASELSTDEIESAQADEVGTDLTFFEDSNRSQARDNLYHIHRYGENLVLVNRWHPVILILSSRNGTYEESFRYEYEDADYFSEVIAENRRYHESEENVYSWKTLVRDSAIQNDRLLLLVGTQAEESGEDYSNHLFVLDLEEESIRPKQIYKLALDTGDIPWIRNMAIDEDGNLLATSNDYDGLLRFDLNLND